MNPNVQAALDRDALNAWIERYRLALRNGFSDSDARFHADQAAALVRRQQET